eukprot:Em0006g944a
MQIVRPFVLALLCGVHRSFVDAQLLGCGASFTDSQVASLIANNYAGSGQGNRSHHCAADVASGVQVSGRCLSSSGFRDQYRFVSIVAYFTTSDATVSDPGVPIHGQFEFECVNSAWSASSSLLDATVLDRSTLQYPSSLAISVASRTDLRLLS